MAISVSDADNRDSSVSESPAMDRFESLTRAILWLASRDWGRSVLLGVLSIVALGMIPQNYLTDAILNGSAFRAGFYVGTILMPDEIVGGHSLFGIAAVFLVLVGFWFVVLLLMRRLLLLRDTRPSSTPS
jgi:hypothetical protein